MSDALMLDDEAGLDDALGDFFAGERERRKEGRAAVEAAVPALDRLVGVMAGRSGQCYKVRGLLYSIWNGQATALNELLGLDWAVRKDVCAVLLAFGYEDDGVSFFYDAISDRLKAAGQFGWFLEAHE